MKIAVVGGGISGLICAHYLSKKHEVTLYDQGPKPGGHVHTVNVNSLNVDTGFIVFNRRFYPTFCQLINELDVESQPTKMSFSVQDVEKKTEYSGSTFASLFADRRQALRPSHWRLVNDIRRFMQMGGKLNDLPLDLTVEL